MAVLEIANLILRKEYREAGISDQEADEWWNHHRATLEDVHGPDAVEHFRRSIERSINRRRKRSKP